jgi:hypothetical protein
LTSSEDEDIIKWQEYTGAEYPFCQMDDITLKTMIRSNPGLMLLKKGVVVRKWSNSNLPDEYQLTDRLENLPLGHSDERSFMLKIVHVVAWFALPLLFFCLLDLVWERYRKNRYKENEK